jgi:hypothetical protein
MHITPRSENRYRCYLNRSHTVAETGEREFIQLRAPSAATAAHLALHVTGATAIVEVERIEELTS